jgi:hypothetical protein
MRYKVTEQGPIDQHPPGEDVTDVYPPDVLKRLVKEGYVAEDKPEPEKAVSDGD